MSKKKIPWIHEKEPGKKLITKNFMACVFRNHMTSWNDWERVAKESFEQFHIVRLVNSWWNTASKS